MIAFGKSSNSFPLVGGSTFSVPFGVDNNQLFFVLPVDVTLTGIAANFNNFSSFVPNAGTQFTPYIAVATPAIGTYNFTIIPASISYASSSYIGGVNNPNTTILSVVNNALAINITAGTIIAIVGGWTDLSGTQSLSEFIYMEGSLFFS
ncbi:hypothetical protein WAX46_08015 [Bacillus sp. FJAT-53060]